MSEGIQVSSSGIAAGGSSGAGFNASDVPRFSFRTDPADAQLSPADQIALTTGVETELNTSTTVLTDQGSNLFEQVSDGNVRYIGTKPFYLFFAPSLSGDMNSGTFSTLIVSTRRNDLAVPSGYFCITPRSGKNADVTPSGSGVMLVNPQDIISMGLTNVTSNDDYDMRYQGLTGWFGGWATESDVLGAELFENPNIDDDTGFTGGNASLDDSVDNELLVTATAGTGYADASITGLEIGERYRVVASAKRGAQGTTQKLGFTDWGNTTTTDITTTSEQTVVIDIVATATSGFFRFQANSVGAVGDEIIITGLSVKKYL